MSATASWQIQHASLADVRSMSSILNSAFKPLTQYKSLYDIQASDEGTATEAVKTQEILGIWQYILGRVIHNPQCWVYKAIDPDTNQIVGFSAWKAPATIRRRHHPQTLIQRVVSWWHSFTATFRTYMPFAIRSLWYPVLGRRYLEQRLWRDELMAEMEAKHISARDQKEGYWMLYILAIDPRYERKGIARLLVADGLRMADEDDTPVFLTSTMTGKGLYERLGFDTLETMPLGDDEHGSWEEYVHRLERKSSRSRSSQAS